MKVADLETSEIPKLSINHARDDNNQKNLLQYYGGLTRFQEN